MKIRTILLLMCLAVQSNAQFFSTYQIPIVQSQQTKLDITENAAGFMICGSTDSAGIPTGFLMQLNSNGFLQWTKEYSDSLNGSLYFTHITNSDTTPNSVEVFGNINSQFISLKLDATGTISNNIVRYDGGGEVTAADSKEWQNMGTWNHTSGQPFKTPILPHILDVTTYVDQQLFWGSSGATGATGATGLSVAKLDTMRAVICKLDTAGFTLGLYIFKYPRGTANYNYIKRIDLDATTASIDSTSDGGYIVSGTLSNNNIFLLKIDLVGNPQWTNVYVTPAPALPSTIYPSSVSKVIETNSGFVVGFSFYSDTLNFTDTIITGGILKIDFSGAPIWTKKIDGVKIDNLIKFGSNFVMVGRMRQLGITYPFVGSIDSSGVGCYPDQNFVIPTQNTIAAHRNGICFSHNAGPASQISPTPTTTTLNTTQADICQILAVQENHQTKETDIYPNPFTDRIDLGESSYHVFDISGRELAFGHSHGFVDLSFLSDGIYFVQMKNLITKLVKTK